MYRRPKSLEVLLAIRTAMSEEAGHDISTFVEMIRSGILPGDKSKTVTRVDGEFCEELQPEEVPAPSKVNISDE